MNQREIDRRAAIVWAREMLADDKAVILDTETTSLDGEPVEIAVIDMAGKILLNTLVQAVAPVSLEARRVHRISDEMLIGAPLFPDVYARLCKIIREASWVVIYNAAFDMRILNNARTVHGLPDYPDTLFDCAMNWYAQWYGEWNHRYGGYRWQRLNGGHRALGDCLATLAALKEMAESNLIQGDK